MVAKLARGTTQLAFWRKPVEASPDAVSPAVASASIGPPTVADAPKPSWFARLKQKLRRGKDPAALAAVAAPVLAVVTTPAVAADVTPAPPPVEAPPPPPPLVPQELEEMLELSDFVAPSPHDDMLLSDDTPEERVQALASSEVAQANPVGAYSLAAEMDSPELEPEPEETADIAQAETAQAEALQAAVPQPEATPKAAAVTAPPPAEATPDEGDEPHKPKLVSRLLATLTKKWVWIPSVSVAMLAIVGTLSYMLMQSKQATHELQAELASAKKQFKQAPIQPEVAPPVLVAHQDVTPHQTGPAETPAETVAHAEPAPHTPPTVSPVALASPAPAARPNVDLDCEISDKASVAKNLKNCIEAFNQATSR